MVSTVIYFKFIRTGNFPVPLPRMVPDCGCTSFQQLKLLSNWNTSQGLRRIRSEKNKFIASTSIDASLRPSATRRDRTFGLPPAFESLINDESDSFWSNSSGTDSLPASAEFHNFADEDTWASLNKDTQQDVADEDNWGNMNECHVNTDSRVSHALPKTDNRRGSRQVFLLAEGSSKITMVNDPLLVLFCIICDSRSYFSTCSYLISLLYFPSCPKLRGPLLMTDKVASYLVFIRPGSYC